jgi:transketolase
VTRMSGGKPKTYSDYARPAIRLASLMELPSIFVFTHDAMGDGGDGPNSPTHRTPDISASHPTTYHTAPG